MAEGEKENELSEANAIATSEAIETESQQQDGLHMEKAELQVPTQLSSPPDAQDKPTDTPKDVDSNSENPVDCDYEGHSIIITKAEGSSETGESGNQREVSAQSADASMQSAPELKHVGNEEQVAVMQDQPESEADTEVQGDEVERSIEGDVHEIDSSVKTGVMASENQQARDDSLDDAMPNTTDLNPKLHAETTQERGTSTAVECSDTDVQTIDLTSESAQEQLHSPQKDRTDMEMLMVHSTELSASTDHRRTQKLPSTNGHIDNPVESSNRDSEKAAEEQRDVEMEEVTAATDDTQAVALLLDEGGDQEMNEAKKPVEDEDEVVSETETVVQEDDEDFVQANAAELSELSKAPNQGESSDQEMEKVVDAPEDTEMANAVPDSVPEGEQWFGDEDMSTEGYAIAISAADDDEALENSIDTPIKQSGLKRKRPTSEPYSGEVVEISSDEEKTSKFSDSSSSSSSSSSSGSSSSSSSGSSSGSDSSDTEKQSPPKRQVSVPVTRKRVPRGSARPAIALDDYKIFKDVDPLMRDTPILKGKYSVHGVKYARFTGMWGFSTEDFDYPEKVSKFEYTTRKLQGRRENDRRPVSGRYTGYFNFRQFGGKIVRIQESVVELDFRKIRPPESLPSGSNELIEADLSEESSDAEGGDAQYVVYGKGKNHFGRFLIHGYLNPADGRLVVRRKYLE